MDHQPATSLPPIRRPSRFTGELLRSSNPAKYRRVVQLLAENVPVYKIQTLCRVSQHTVNAIQIRASQAIAEHKKRLASLCFDVSEQGFEHVERRLKGMSDRDIIIASGVAAQRGNELTNTGPEIAIGIQVNSEESGKLSAALKALNVLPPEIES